MDLPSPGMTIDARRTALVITDLQNDFLSPGGIAWGLVAESLAENNTIETSSRCSGRPGATASRCSSRRTITTRPTAPGCPPGVPWRP